MIRSRVMARLNGDGNDRGASLVFVLVVISVLTVLISSFNYALTSRVSDATVVTPGTGGSSLGLTEQALSLGVTSYKSSGSLATKNSWQWWLKGLASANKPCFNFSSSATSGTKYLDLTDPATGKVARRVFCTPYSVATTANGTFIQTNKQPDIGNGLAIGDQIDVCGTGNYYVQGGITALNRIGFYADNGCNTPRTSTCPQATLSNQNALTTSGCPALYDYDSSPGNGVVTSSSCDSKAIYAASGYAPPTTTRCAPLFPTHALASVVESSSSSNITGFYACNWFGIGMLGFCTGSSNVLTVYTSTVYTVGDQVTISGANASVDGTCTVTSVDATAGNHFTCYLPNSVQKSGNSGTVTTYKSATATAAAGFTVAAGNTVSIDGVDSSVDGQYSVIGVAPVGCTTACTAVSFALESGRVPADSLPTNTGTISVQPASLTAASQCSSTMQAACQAYLDDTATPTIAAAASPAGASVVDMAGQSASGAGATCSGASATLRPGVYKDTVSSKNLGAANAVSNFLNGLGAGTAQCGVQAGALSATSSADGNAATVTATVSDRTGFIPGDTLTIGSATYTVAPSYVPATGAGTLTLDPVAAPVALNSVNVGTPVTSLTVAATSQATPTQVATVKSGSNTTVTVTSAAATTQTTTASGMLSGSANVTLSASNANITAGQYVKGTGITAGTTVSSVGTWAAFTQKGTFAKTSKSVTLDAANPGIYVGQSVTGTGIAASTTVSAISGTTLTLSANTTAANGAGGNTLTFAGGAAKLVLSANASATSSTAVTLSFYSDFSGYTTTAGTYPAAGGYLYFSGATGTDAYEVNNAYLPSSVATDKTSLTYSIPSYATAAAMTDTGAGLRITKTVVTGSTTLANASMAVGDVLAFNGSGNATVDGSTCFVASISADTKSFTCILRSATAVSAATLSNGVFIDLGAESKNFTTNTSTYPNKVTTVAATSTAANTLAANDVIKFAGTGDADLDGTSCTVAAAGTTFTCTLAAADSTQNAFLGTTGTVAKTITFTSGTAVTAARSCIDVNGPWCHVTTGTTITNVTMTTGDYFFDLGQDFKLNSAAVSWNAGLLPTVTQTGTTTSGNAAVTLSAATSGVYVGQAVTGTGIANGTTVSSLSGTALTLSAPATASGSTSLSFSGGCAPTYSSTASPADATPPAHGVTLAFGGASGLAWYAGNFTACPKPVDVGLHPTDRPVVVYGPTTALTGSITVPAYYRDTMTGSGTAFTSPVSDSISARGTCAMSDAVDTCDIVDVPVVGGRAYDTNSCGNVACGTDGTQMRLYGAVFAQSSRVSLSLNPVNSDSMTLYGVVAKNLRVITNGLQVSADPSLFGISSGLSSILDPKNILVRFTAYSCTNNTLYPIPPATGGTSVCGPTGGGQTTSPDANWQGSQFTISGVSADGTTATMTTSAAHGLATGEQVVISGFTGASSAYNTTSTPATVTVTSATTFTIPSTTIAALAGSPKVTYGPPQAFSFFGLSFSAGSSYTSACPPTTVYPWVGCLVESFNTTTETSYLTPVGAGPIASNSPPWLIVG